MPQKIKYVGPKPEKEFRGFFFTRDVSDDASGGRNAVEVPDEVAHAALKHRDVFMQWDKPVPDKVKALRDQLPGALEAEGRRHHDHFVKRKVVAELTITADSEIKEEQLRKEIEGAEREMEHGLGLIRQAEDLRARIAAERGDASAPVLPQATSQSEKDLLALVLSLKEEIEKLKAGQTPNNPALAQELSDIRTSMQNEIDKDLATLGLSAKVLKTLEDDGFTQIAQLIQESPETLLQVNGIGPAALKEIQTALADKGHALLGEGGQGQGGGTNPNPGDSADTGSQA